MKRFDHLVLCLLLFIAVPLLAPGPAGSSTVAPPADLGHLARISDAVAYAQAIDSWVEEGVGIPYTVTRFQLLRQVAGARPGLVFEVREPGGSVGRRAAVVAGAPRFETGRNYLLFLDRAGADNRWRTRMLSYGLLEESPDGELLRPLPEASNLEVLPAKAARHERVGIYRKQALLEHLGEVSRGAAWDRRRVAGPAGTETAGTEKAAQGAPLAAAGEPLTAPSGCHFLTHPADNRPIRWFGFENGSSTATVFATTPGQNGISDGGASAVQQGVLAWTTDASSVIRLTYGGTRARQISCTGQPGDPNSFDYDSGGVVFNDPCNDLTELTSSCAGTLAFGGALYDPTRTVAYDGEQWHPAISMFVVINNGAECVGEVSFREVVSHELGHTQGFSHHNPPIQRDALMSAMLKGDGLGAALRPMDKTCASFSYHTFLDVPYSRWSWPYVEAIENAAIDNGCGGGNYCPTSPVNRASMAVFLVRGERGGGYLPPAATGTIFQDVPASHPQAAYIEQLYRDGLTGGCSTSPRRYCPDDLVTRAQMSTFLVRVKNGTGYTPPPAKGTVFQDVPASYWAAPYIEQLYVEGGTAGCGTNPARYCPEDKVQREQIATFLVRAFNLPLP